MTLAAWHARYMQIRRHEIGPATRALHARTLDLLLEVFGDVPLASIGKRQAQEFRLHLTAERRYVESTVCKHIRTCKTLWKTAMDWEYVSESPWQGVRSTAPVLDVTDREPLSLDQGEALIAAAGPRWRAVVAVLFYGGLRRGEATRLRWDDIDFETGRILVRNEGQQTSKRRARVVRLEPRLADILSRCDRSHPRVVGAGCSERSGLSHIVRTIGNRAGIEGVTPQVLRQARSTIWFSEFPSHVAAAWMGHSAEVARRHYLGVPDAFYAPSPVGGEGTSFTSHGPERTVSGPAHAIGATRWLPQGNF